MTPVHRFCAVPLSSFSVCCGPDCAFLCRAVPRSTRQQFQQLNKKFSAIRSDQLKRLAGATAVSAQQPSGELKDADKEAQKALAKIEDEKVSARVCACSVGLSLITLDWVPAHFLRAVYASCAAGCVFVEHRNAAGHHLLTIVI